MRNAGCQQGKHERSEKIKVTVNRNTSNEIFGERIRQFLHKFHVLGPVYKEGG